PAAIQIHAGQRAFGDDGRAVHGHVHDAAPAAQQPQPRHGREHRHHLAHDLLHERQVSALGVAVVAVEIAAEDEATLVRLGHVEMAAAESDDAIEIGLDRFRDEGLQNVAFDGEAFDAGEPKDAARASGDRYGDLSSANLAARAGDADYRVPLAQKACHLAILDDVHAKRSEEHTSELQSRENLVCRLL